MASKDLNLLSWKKQDLTCSLHLIIVLPLEHKIQIFSQPWNIQYIFIEKNNSIYYFRKYFHFYEVVAYASLKYTMD